ncbi:hypothetical protein HPB52_019014 [Rhipicephalus sanguineus]|uniref:Major facilitator superfamily (MFS) profile domain-containing protein n=1 Tax=Rhipicephalus sanguineus TaxID=34632 RepID=A0A9D4QBT2_RHISA|nr:hypothetical protein HPB52_019014 [Rhipicephalus sanguineus]
MRQAGAKRRATSSRPMVTSSTHEGQQDTDSTAIGREGEPATTTNQPVAATTPLPSLEGRRETAIIPGDRHQWTTVDQPLPAGPSSLSPHEGQRDVKVACGKESEQVTTNQFATATATPLSPCVGHLGSSMISSEKDRLATLNQPLTALTHSLSPHDGQWDTAKMSSGKENEQTTANQSTTALTTPLSPWECRQELAMMPKDQRATINQPLTALTSSLSLHDGQQREALNVAVTGGTEGERTVIQTAPVVKTASDPASPLSPLEEGQHEAHHQTTTVVAATTAATAAAPSSPLDHVLICGHGRFQIMVLVCTTLAFFTAIEHALASTDLARPVDHWCKPPARYSYMDPEIWRNISIPVVLEEDGAERRSQCQRFEPPLPYSESSAESPDNRTAVFCDAGWEYESGDSHLHSIVDEWNLVCRRSWIVSALAAAYMAGGVVGSALAGIAADRVGRRPVLGVWLVLLVFAGTALVFANSVPLFATLRFLLSAGAAGVLVASHVLLFEVTDTQHRVMYCAIAVAGATFVAAVYTELIHVFIRNWHAAQVAYMVPSCGLIAAAYLVEESPCWLLAFSEVRYAEYVLSRAASANRVEPHLFRHRMSALRVEMSRQHEQLLTHQEQEGPNAIISDHELRLSDLLSNQSLRQRSAVIFGCWFLVFGAFSHLSTGHVMRDNERARSALVVLRLPCVVADVYVLTRAGRRLSLAASMLALSVATGALSAVDALGAPDQLNAVVVVSGLLVFDMSAIAAFAFSAELYPTVLRGSALGCCYMSGYIGAFAASFISEIRSPPLRGAVYAVAAAMLLLLGAMALALPETRHLPPSNTVHGMMVVEDKWQLYSPIRVARNRGKRGRPKTTLPPESHQMRRHSSSAQRQAVLHQNQTDTYC